jgi:hypothetical protein
VSGAERFGVPRGEALDAVFLSLFLTAFFLKVFFAATFAP